MAYDNSSAEITNEVPDDSEAPASTTQGAATPKDDPDSEQAQAVKAQVTKILKTIRADKKHHEKAFKRMMRDQFVVFHGRDTDWSPSNYKANIAGRHVRQKTATLYAKNPKIAAK